MNIEKDYITVAYAENKNAIIPKKELEQLQKNLGIEYDEAVELWLCDNDYIENDEATQLQEKAKMNKTDKIYVADKTKRAKTERKPTENPHKQFIIEQLWAKLAEIEHITDLKITNKTKLIEFSYQNKQFKLDLVEKRAKKV